MKRSANEHRHGRTGGLRALCRRRRRRRYPVVGIISRSKLFYRRQIPDECANECARLKQGIRE